MSAERRRRPLRYVGGAVRTGGEPALARRLATVLTSLEARDPDALTHGFHAYPARMHPAVAASALAAFARPGARVLDPFCGSGTVLVECRVAGLHSLGVDLNPLALRIAEVKCDLRSATSRRLFAEKVGAVAERSRDRVRGRVDVRASLPPREVAWYQPHVLKELAGLREEILAEGDERDRRALEVVLSAIVVKFSRQRADTATRTSDKRIRKGLATDFFERKGAELVERWAALAAAAPGKAPAPRLVPGDARELPRLLPRGKLADLVLTSPPYGGTYDYLEHHVRRFAWLGLGTRELSRLELGARRDLRGEEAPSRWDAQVRAMLAALARSLSRDGLALLLVGDAQLGRVRLPADTQLRRLAPSASLVVRATATQPRPDWTGGGPRAEHLVALSLA